MSWPFVGVDVIPIDGSAILTGLLNHFPCYAYLMMFLATPKGRLVDHLPIAQRVRLTQSFLLGRNLYDRQPIAHQRNACSARPDLEQSAQGIR